MSAETLDSDGSAWNAAGGRHDPNRSVFTVPAKGPTYYVSWVAVGIFVFFMVVSLWSGVSPIVSLVGFGAFVALGLAGVLYFHAGRTFEADLQGVRVTHGRRVARDIPWAEVKHVRYGVQPVVVARSARPGPFLMVSCHGVRRGIDFNTQDYPGHPELDDALAAFAKDVARLAALRGIPAEWKDWTQPRWRQSRGPD